jgi:hypothetical protein
MVANTGTPVLCTAHRITSHHSSVWNDPSGDASRESTVTERTPHESCESDRRLCEHVNADQITSCSPRNRLSYGDTSVNDCHWRQKTSLTCIHYEQTIMLRRVCK